MGYKKLTFISQFHRRKCSSAVEIDNEGSVEGKSMRGRVRVTSVEYPSSAHIPAFLEHHALLISVPAFPMSQ
jgi:hypothetical protein